MTQTTPTRDEAVHDRIAGPTVAVPLKIVERIRAYRVSLPYDPVLSQIEIDMNIALATAPAPAIGGVDAVAWRAVCDFVNDMLSDWAGGDDCRIGFGVNGATVTKGQFRAVQAALASLSPAATPVSEAGGEAVARSWRRTKFEFIGAMRQALINSGLTREQVIIADNAITEAFSALAKPASPPAGGDVGDSVALSMDSDMRNSDFETWACKRGYLMHLHEGDESRRYRYSLTEEAWLGWCAALSQSTSAGRVGE